MLTLLLKGGRASSQKNKEKKWSAPGYILSPEQFNLQFDPKAKLWLVLLLTLFFFVHHIPSLYDTPHFCLFEEKIPLQSSWSNFGFDAT